MHLDDYSNQGFEKDNYRKNNYQKDNFHKGGGYNDKYDNKHRNNRRDHDGYGQKDEDSKSTNSLSGFGKGGPVLFFNKKKSEVDSSTLKEPVKANPESDKKQEKDEASTKTPLEPIKEKAKVESKESDLIRRNTDNEYEIENLPGKADKKNVASGTIANKVDANVEESKEVLKPRHSDASRGKPNNRKPRGNFFKQVLDTHIEPHSDKPGAGMSQSTQERPSEKGTTLIGDRPEAEQYAKQSYNKPGFRNNRGGFRNRTDDQYSAKGQFSDNRSYRQGNDDRNSVRSRGGRGRGRGSGRGRGNDRGRGRGNGRGRGGFKHTYDHKQDAGYNNYDKAYSQYDKYSQKDKFSQHDKYSEHDRYSQYDKISYFTILLPFHPVINDLLTFVLQFTV